MRAFAWKEVSTETLHDSCPDPLLFLLFSRRFPAPSLLLGLLRLHQIEQLLFRVDLKLGIDVFSTVSVDKIGVMISTK